MITVSLSATILSFVAAWRGSCNGEVFSLRAVAVVMLSTLLAMSFTKHVSVAVAIVIGTLTVSAVSDACSGYVYDAVAFLALMAVFVAQTEAGAAVVSLVGAAVSACAAMTIRNLSRGGLGIGDVKLFALTGAAFGAIDGIKLIGLAFVVAAVVVVPLLALGKLRRSDAVPFAPFIGMSTLALCVVGL